MKATNKIGSMFLRCILLRMKELGVSQTELAKRMNASRPYVVKVLHGDVNITFASAARFAKALGLDFVPRLQGRAEETQEGSTAFLSNEGRMVSFSFGGRCVRFLGAKCLRRFVEVRKWNAGYIEVMADNGGRIEEDYIDLVPILENLCIDPSRYVKPIKKVELNYA